MNTSGEAADQVMRMMLNGAEVLVKLSGSGAKNAAVLLYSIAREQKKTKGAARLESMLRSGKPLKVYTFKDSDLPKFKEVAKQYGVLFAVLKEKDKTGGVFDVMVRAEDESKIARITERFNLARVNTADLRAEIIREKALHALNEEIPHGIAVGIDQMKYRKGIYDIDATIVCERDSHKGIIIGKQGAMLKKIGTNARYEIERLLDTKVNLKLWVKVKKDWRDSDFLIKNFGYREDE